MSPNSQMSTGLAWCSLSYCHSPLSWPRFTLLELPAWPLMFLHPGSLTPQTAFSSPAPDLPLLLLLSVLPKLPFPVGRVLFFSSHCKKVARLNICLLPQTFTLEGSYLHQGCLDRQFSAMCLSPWDVHTTMLGGWWWVLRTLQNHHFLVPSGPVVKLGLFVDLLSLRVSILPAQTVPHRPAPHHFMSVSLPPPAVLPVYICRHTHPCMHTTHIPILCCACKGSKKCFSGKFSTIEVNSKGSWPDYLGSIPGSVTYQLSYPG